MDKKNVLVTGIGGNVGQGIIRNIRSTDFDIKVVGCNIVDFSAGNHLCDVFYKVPYAYDAEYISVILDIIKVEKIDLIIPSTDYEAYFLSEKEEVLPCKLACSDLETTSIYIDKYKTFLHHKLHDIPFAEAQLPSEFDATYKEYILKPRKGRGSRGLHINPKDLTVFSDKEYMVQQLIRGQEITCAFYIDKSRSLHGMITFERELENGATNRCIVVDKYDDRLLGIIHKMMDNCNFRGAANLQAIVTETGEIQPFEINCRISGTNSIRSNFGFMDVKYTLQEQLYNTLPDSINLTKGIAVRVLMDVIYPEQTEMNTLKDNSSPHYLF